MSKKSKTTIPLDITLNLTPSKRKKKLQNSKCILKCNLEKDEHRIRFSKRSREVVYHAAQLRNDDTVISILDTFEEELPSVDYGYHRKCYQRYTNKRLLEKLNKDIIDPEETTQTAELEASSSSAHSILQIPRTSCRKRGRQGKILADYECCICGRRKTAQSGSGHEPLIKCVTENGAKTLQQEGRYDDYPSLRAEVAGVDWQTIVAREYYYHKSCYKKLAKKQAKRTLALDNADADKADKDQFFYEVIRYITEKVIDGCEVVRVSDISKKYFEIADQFPGDKDSLVLMTAQKLKEKIQNYFGESVGFWRPSYGSELMFNDNIEKGKLVEMTVRAKLANRKWEDKTPEEKTTEVAQEIRKELLEIPDTYSSWPPSEKELLSNETSIPTLTTRLLEGILVKKTAKLSKVSRLVSSIGQDLIYHTNNGQKHTSKHTTFSFLIKRKTGSKQVIGWTNKFGHGISYNDVLLIETHLAIEHSQDQLHRSFTPSIIQPSHFVTFVWDNNDINPESLKGYTLHCTNGIIIQSSTAHLNAPQQPSSNICIADTTRKPRSFQAMHSEIAPYIQVKRKCTEAPTDVDLNLYQEEAQYSREIDTLWIVAKSQSSKLGIQQLIPNWTGFNYLVCGDDCDNFHNIGYLPAINQSPTSHDTVLELLSQSKLKAEKLGLTETDVVLDMAIYAKAVEVIMNPRYVDLKKFIVLRLGAFHTMCIFIAIIGKRFSDAGLRDIIVESNLLGESSVDQMFRGKHYNNAMRVLKYLYDAMKRHMIEGYEHSIQNSDLEAGYREFVESAGLQMLISSPSVESFETFRDDHQDVINHIHAYENSLLTGFLGPTASIWSSFVQMVQILLDFSRSIKLGDWKLHLQSTENMLPWMFAYDRPNYARFLTYYLICMKKLPETHPSIHQEFEAGHFSVRRQQGKFNKIPSDQAIEQTINRQQKCAGGIIGFSTSEGTVQRWALTNHVAAKCQSNVEAFLGMSDDKCITKDLAAKRILFDEECVMRCFDLVKEWGTPFKENNRLIHLSSGLECSAQVENDMVNAEARGKEAFVNFIKKRIESDDEDLYSPIPKMKLNTFASMKTKKSCSVKERSVTLKADRDIFARLLVICGKREITLKEVLVYSLGPIPWSLATLDGNMSKTIKSKLLDVIENTVDDPTVNALPNNCVRIYDGMVIIQQLSSLCLATFGEISEYVLKRITSHSSKVIYFVTDQYYDNSLKGCERTRRASAGSIRIQLTRRDQKPPKQFKKYLSDGCNKVDLVKFFLADWSDPDRFKTMIVDRIIFVTVESVAYRLQVTSDKVTSTPEEALHSKQEEADTKMFLSCQHAVQQFACENICISTVDSDVGILSIYYKDRLQCELFVELGSKSKKRILSVSTISHNIGKEMSDALPALHAISGCDFTSAFYGIGKQKIYKIAKSSDCFKEVLSQIGDTFDFDLDLFPVVQKMIAECYGIKGCDSINDARYRKFCSKAKVPDPQQLPPTEDELLLHCQRANYVAKIWKSALIADIDLPHPAGYGWREVDGLLEIKWMSQKPAPDSLLEFLACGCKKSGCQSNRCLCVTNGLSCTDLCDCSTCANTTPDEDDVNTRFELDEEIDE